MSKGLGSAMNPTIKIIDYDPRYAKKTVAMWRKSKEQAIGQKEGHSFENHIFFLNHMLNKDNDIKLAIESQSDRVVGLLAFNRQEINQLYVHSACQNRGIGRTLVGLAKKESGGRLRLYTFEVNHKAQRFYERNGFVVIARGHENEEGLDDLLYEWVASSPRNQ